MSVHELRVRAEGVTIVHERTQMVWTRGDNLIHGLTQLGLLIDSLFDFKEEEVDSSVFCTYTYARAYQSLSLYVYVKKILSRRRKESEENKKKEFSFI